MSFFMSVEFATMLTILYGASVVTLIFVFGDTKSESFRRFFHFGPGTKEVPIEFAGISLDTPLKYSLFILFLVFQSSIWAFTGSILSDWYQYEIFNPDRTELSMAKSKIWFIDTLLDVVGFITGNFSTLIFLATQQIQFELVGFISRFIPNQFYMYRRLKDKKAPK